MAYEQGQPDREKRGDAVRERSIVGVDQAQPLLHALLGSILATTSLLMRIAPGDCLRFHRNRVHDIKNGLKAELEHRKNGCHLVHVRWLVCFNYSVTTELPDANQELVEMETFGHLPLFKYTQDSFLRCLVIRVGTTGAFPPSEYIFHLISVRLVFIGKQITNLH